MVILLKEVSREVLLNATDVSFQLSPAFKIVLILSLRWFYFWATKGVNLSVNLREKAQSFANVLVHNTKESNSSTGKVLQSITYQSKTNCIPSFIHTYIHSFIHTFSQTFIHSYIHSYIHSFIQTFIHSYIHSYIHSFIHFISFILHLFTELQIQFCNKLNSLLFVYCLNSLLFLEQFITKNLNLVSISQNVIKKELK